MKGDEYKCDKCGMDFWNHTLDCPRWSESSNNEVARLMKEIAELKAERWKIVQMTVEETAHAIVEIIRDCKRVTPPGYSAEFACNALEKAILNGFLKP